jgi:hypothetical protein
MIRRPFPPEGLAALLGRFNTEITAKRELHRTRRHRSYPRVVKRARHNQYAVKKPTDIGMRHAGPPTLRIANLPPAQQLAHPGRIGTGTLELTA